MLTNLARVICSHLRYFSPLTRLRVVNRASLAFDKAVYLDWEMATAHAILESDKAILCLPEFTYTNGSCVHVIAVKDFFKSRAFKQLLDRHHADWTGVVETSVTNDLVGM